MLTHLFLFDHHHLYLHGTVRIGIPAGEKYFKLAGVSSTLLFLDNLMLGGLLNYKFRIWHLLYFFPLNHKRDKPMFYAPQFGSFSSSYHPINRVQLDYKIPKVILFHRLLHHSGFYELLQLLFLNLHLYRQQQ